MKTLNLFLWVLLLASPAMAIPQTFADAQTDLGLKGDGSENIAPALLAAFKEGKRSVYFPKGLYKLGTLEVPSGVHLKFSVEARIVADVAALKEFDCESSRIKLRPLFYLTGKEIVIDGLNAAGVFQASKQINRKREVIAVTAIVYGNKASYIQLRNLTIELPEDRKLARMEHRPQGVVLDFCEDIEYTGCCISNLSNGIETSFCRNLSVHGNRAFNCGTLTTFNQGSMGLRHYDNWSRVVTYQCVFRGGSPDPSRKSPRVPLGSAQHIIRGLKPGQEKSYYEQELKKIGATGIKLEPESATRHLMGTYDIEIVNNYAEYGTTLAWGNKSHNVIFEGNVGRFMNDYTYGTEGCENVVFANNISINSRSCGIMTMYWSENVVVRGNLVVIRDEPFIPEYAKHKEQKAYWGGMVRFHHGPKKSADAESGSLYGGGSVIVTGNVFINQLNDRVRRCMVEGGRDVLFSSNKIVNGWVHKGGPGSVNVVGNEFISTMPKQHNMVYISDASESIIKDNIMSYVKSDKVQQKLDEVKTDGKDEMLEATDEEKMLKDLPAIQIGSARGWRLQKVVILGNIIRGYTSDSINVFSKFSKRRTEPMDVVVMDNLLSSGITFDVSKGACKSIVTGNTGLEGTGEIKATVNIFDK